MQGFSSSPLSLVDLCRGSVPLHLIGGLVKGSVLLIAGQRLIHKRCFQTFCSLNNCLLVQPAETSTVTEHAYSTEQTSRVKQGTQSGLNHLRYQLPCMQVNTRIKHAYTNTRTRTHINQPTNQPNNNKTRRNKQTKAILNKRY